MTFYQGTNGRVAVLLPGRNYSPDHPFLYYARAVLLTQGWSIEEVWWTPADPLASIKFLGDFAATMKVFLESL